MLSKEGLREEFSKNPELYYYTRLFTKEGFERKKCPKCGMHFWTCDKDRVLCGDPSHEPYAFFKDKPRDVGYVEAWKMFSEFFAKNDHEIIDKYPVVSRWRPDLYFTIAGIQDFQRIENGKMSFEYPANPLLVPQICMRFNDVANVGVTGRHGTSFMMANQTAFNYPKEGYWRDRTIELNFRCLTDVLGVDKKTITYIEDVWAMGDFSEFGPSLEFFSKGLELGNNVFTQFEYVDGKTLELKGKVVDVGWGFERFIWYMTGKQTVYDAIYPKELEYIHKEMEITPDARLYSKVAGALASIDLSEMKHGSDEEKMLVRKAGVTDDEYNRIIKPMQAAYAIADHTRTTLFAITDGALPSNVGGGYNLRVLLRRIFDFMQRYGKKHVDVVDFLMKVIEMHAKELKPLYKDIDSALDTIRKVIAAENGRNNATKSAASGIANKIIKSGEKLTIEKLRTLYESNGISPEFLESVARSMGKSLEIPEEAYARIMKGDFAEVHRHANAKQIKINTEGLPRTEQLFYKFVGDVHSKVLKCEGNNVILDQTPFYAEGGGQEADFGTINGHEVDDVQSINGVIVHIMKDKPPFKTGENVHCLVDLKRRLRLMAHHTATHLVNASARKVLGKHAWQEGASKTPNKATIDIAHFEKLTQEQVQEIENTANEYIINGIRVTLEELPRQKAESTYGFTIYQGHGAPSGTLRIIVIKDLQGNLIDAQACGGLHLIGRETAIGLIKIIASSRPHDGIDRLEYVAGPAAVEYVNRMEKEINEIAGLAESDKDKLKVNIKVKMEQAEASMRQAVSLEKELASMILENKFNQRKEKEVIERVDFNRDMLRNIANLFIAGHQSQSILLHNPRGDIVAISGPKSEANALELVKGEAKKLKKEFKGGGTKSFAQGALI